MRIIVLLSVLLIAAGAVFGADDCGPPKSPIFEKPDRSSKVIGLIPVAMLYPISDSVVGYTAKHPLAVYNTYRKLPGGGYASPELIMGGDLTVESVPGRGSCFIVNLPKIACTDQPPLVAESEEEDDQLSGRVLLVDDVPMNLRVLQAMATTLGFECVCAANGREALAIFDREQKFDVILTDLWMPEMNGMELAEWIAERTGGALPVIAVTADTQIAGELPGGFAGVLLKPITPRTLGKAIREARRKR